METKNTGKTIVRAIGSLVAIAAICLIAYTFVARHIKSAHIDAIIMDLLEILSLASIAVYCAMGSTKKAALFYKLFICIFAVSKLVNIYGLSNSNLGPAALLPESIVFGMLCILGLATDLGKMKSLIFGFIALLISGFSFIVCVINNIGDIFDTVPCIANTAMCAILLLMILAKYYDKAERGSK